MESTNPHPRITVNRRNRIQPSTQPKLVRKPGSSIFVFLFTLVLIPCLLAPNLYAETQVGGTIAQDTTWTIADSPYIVTDNILVVEGITLTIDPGTVVRFDEDRALRIDGSLLARGSVTDKITFTSNHSNGNWAYILFTDTSVDAKYDINGNYTGGSILEYCIVEHAKGAEVVHDGAIRIEAAHPFISRCSIENNQVSGIHAWSLTGNLKIERSSIINNRGSGISTAGGTVMISGNTIRNNDSTYYGGGIHFDGGDSIKIKDNIIMNNDAKWYGGGISLDGVGPADVSGNMILHNSGRWGSGISINFTSCDIYNNLIGNNAVVHRDGGSGGGIYNDWQWGSTFSNIYNNVLFENDAGFGSGGGISIDDGDDNINTNISNNTIVRNMAEYAAAINYCCRPNQTIQQNTITGNHSRGSGPNYAIYIENFPLLEANNIFNNNSDYELYNNNPEGSIDLRVENNWWGVESESDISAKIYDWLDDATKGLVDFDPWETNIRTDSPMSPPVNIVVTNGNDSITLTWDQNPENDIAGYKVYWRENSGLLYTNVVDHPYTNVSDVGSDTTYTLSGLTEGEYSFTITAYDNSYDPANDDPLTQVNENQTNGNESWYAAEQVVSIGPRIQTDPEDYDFGNINTASNSVPETFTITNSGNKDLVIGLISIIGSDATNFSIQSDAASGETLNPGDNASIMVVFSPESNGLKTAYLSIPSNDTERPFLRVPLVGVGGTQIVYGALEWKYEGSGFESPVIGSNGTVYAGSSETYPNTGERKFYAFNPDGTVKWVFPIERGTFGPLGDAKASVGDNGTIYVANTYGSKFYAINPDGTLKWFFQPDAWKNGAGSTWSQPAIASDGTIYLGSRESGLSEEFGNTNWGDGKLYALNPDGTLKWEIDIESGLTAPAIASDGTIYTGTAGGCKVRAINPDGSVRWVFEAPGLFWLSSSPAIGPDGTIYIGTFDVGGKSLYAINPNGSKKWKFETGNTIKSSPAVGKDGTVYVGSDDKKFYAINPDGTEKWSFETGDAVESSPAIGIDGTIYFGSQDKKLYALNPDGTLRWSYQADDPIISSPAIGTSGALYVGSSSDLLAIESGSKGLANSSWPMLGHDARHGGCFMNKGQTFPFANAGQDQVVDETDLVTLNATGSFDPDGTIADYHWMQIAGTAVVLSDPADIQPTFHAPNVGATEESLVFQLIVTDNDELQSADTVVITVNDTFVLPNSHDFGSTVVGGSSAPLEIVISNVESEPIEISDITLSDTQNFYLDLNGGGDPIGTIPTTIPPGSRATVTAVFSPSDPGIFDVEVILTSDDPVTPNATISLSGWARNDPAQENFVVTIGQDKVFNAFNLNKTTGTAFSDAQNAIASVEAGPYENKVSEAWAGVSFQVVEAPDGTQVADATISITFSYKLEVDFDVLPPSEQGGGSADSRIYTWIHNLKEQADYIEFIHEKDYDKRSATITVTHRLSDSPTWTHLYAGQTYEVTADINTHAQVYKGDEALAYAEVTIHEVKIDFDESLPPEPPPGPGPEPSPGDDIEAGPGYAHTVLNDELVGPVEISLDPTGLVLVANEGIQLSVHNDFVAKLNSDGTDANLDFITGLEGASGLAVDNDGNIYISQDLESPLRKYDSDGVFVLEFESQPPGFSDPDTLALTDDGRLLAPVQDVSSSGEWRVLAFDIETGERLSDYTPPFEFGLVHAIAFSGGKLYIAGSPALDGSGPILVAEDGKQPNPYGFNEKLPNTLNGIAVGDSGELFVTDTTRLLSISPDGFVCVLAEGYRYARGVAVADDGCILVSDFRSGTDGLLSRVCPSLEGSIELTAKVIDENGLPVEGALIENLNVQHIQALSDVDGSFTISGWPGYYHTYRVTKAGYVPTYTFPRDARQLNVLNDITIISTATRDEMYDACGIAVDTNKGTVAGIVVDENDQELAGAVVFLTPASGEVYYLDNAGTPDPTLTSTGPSGAFVILNVEPGSYQISALLAGYSFSPVISVNANTMTGDALVGSSSASSSGGGGGGGGGGCFIATTAYGSPGESHAGLVRKFRDRFMHTNSAISAVVKLHSTYSRTLAVLWPIALLFAVVLAGRVFSLKKKHARLV